MHFPSCFLSHVGLLQWGDGVALLIGNQIFSRVSSRKGIPFTACIGALITLFQIGVPLSGSLSVLSFFRYVAMLGAPIQMPAASAITSPVAPRHRMGAWMAATSSAQALVRALTPLLMGPMYDENSSVPFFISSGGVLLAILWAVLLIPRVPVQRKFLPPLPLANPTQQEGGIELVTATDEDPLPSSAVLMEAGGAHQPPSDPAWGVAVADLCAEFDRLLQLKTHFEQADEAALAALEAVPDP